MKSQINKTQEQNNNTVAKVQQESGVGGNTLLTDNRSSTVYQRKLRASMNASSNMESIIQRRENRTGIPNKLKTGFENISGYSMDDVKVHYNSHKPAQLQALAYTQGSNVYIGPRQERHLAHELGHVVQQKMNTVPVTNTLNGVNLNTNPGLEHQADMLGERAIQATTLSNQSIGYKFYEKKSSENGVVQRLFDKPTDYKDYAALKKLHLYALHQYAIEQADWYASPDLNDNERDSIRELLEFYRNRDHVFGSCDTFYVGEIINKIGLIGKDVVYNYLDRFSQLMANSHPFEIYGYFTLKDALWAGEKLDTLLTCFPEYVLKTAMYDQPFNDLEKPADLNALIDYRTNAVQTPSFQSSNKSYVRNDFGAFILLNKEKNPRQYDGTTLQGWIRDYHRFQKKALDTLDNNMKDKTKNKPLTLILHNAIDYSGAYIRNQELTDLITNDALLVIVIQGYETLAGYTNKIKTLAKTYGEDDKIDQVMFAGHASSRWLQLGGKIKKHINEEGESEIREQDDGIDLINNEEASFEIFEEVLDNMNSKSDELKQPHRRILFSACSTNSNELKPYRFEFTRDGQEYYTYNLNRLSLPRSVFRNHYRNWLNNNKNLVNTLIHLAHTKEIDIDVVGSMAPHGPIRFFDNENNLDLKSESDPYITSHNKLLYVKYGKEPFGVLKAVHELYVTLNSRNATDYLTLGITLGSKSFHTTIETLLSEVKKRSKKGSTNWGDAIIESMFKLIALPQYWKNPNYIFAMSELAGTLYSARQDFNCNAKHLGNRISGIINHFGIHKNRIAYIFKCLELTDVWNAIGMVPVVFYQVWMTLNNTRDSHLAYYIGYYDMKEAMRFINVRYMADNELFQRVFNNPANDQYTVLGKLKIALMGTLQGDTVCMDYLKGKLVNNSFPDDLQIGNLLGGIASEQKILELLGAYTPPELNNEEVVSSEKNIRTYEEQWNINTMSVESVTKTGIAKKDAWIFMDIRDEHNFKSDFKILKPGTRCHILGSVGKWWAIEYTYKNTHTTAFIKKENVKIVEQTH